MMPDTPDKKPPPNLFDWLGVSDAPNWAVGKWLGRCFTASLFLLFALAYVAAFGIAGKVVFGGGEVTLGAGGLIAALLGAPFLIWGTILKTQTVRYQKEGHMTDRIAKAVEMLGAEKTVDRIGRPISVTFGNPDESAPGETIARETLIEWQGTPYIPEDIGWVSETGDWQVFSETQPNLEVRIGAILSLERIAQDSTTHDKGRDHVRVMEILCAYIRENAPDSKAENHDLDDWEPLKDNPSDEERAAHIAKRNKRFGKHVPRGKAQEWAKTLSPPRADIAQALTIIGRRTHAQLLVEAAWPDPPGPTTTWLFDTPCPSLPDKPSETAMTKAEVTAYLERVAKWAELIEGYSGYRLDLRGANLQGADMRKGRFQIARFEKTRLEGADLSQARMEGADLTLARMEGATLVQARLEGADLVQARLEGATLVQARLEGADLSAARMEGADLSLARMEGATLVQARLEGADLVQARMDASTSLDLATLTGAALRGVDLSIVEISREQVNASFGDTSVTLPTRLRPAPAHWLAWEPEYMSFDETEITFHSEYQRWLETPDGEGFIPAPPPSPQ